LFSFYKSLAIANRDPHLVTAWIVAKLLSMDPELSYAMAEKPDKDNQEKVKHISRFVALYSCTSHTVTITDHVTNHIVTHYL